MGIEVFDSMADLDTGSSLQHAIKSAIRACDFVVVLYTSPSTNITFEAGVALGLSKPIFSIINPDTETPDILLDSAYVNAMPTDLEKIEFNLGLFYKNIKPKKTSATSKRVKFYGGGEAVPYDATVERSNFLEKNSGLAFELFLKNLFDVYNISVVMRADNKASEFSPDFSIWSDELENILGNPILIEVKTELNPKNVYQLANMVSEYLRTSTATSCLVFYERLRGLDKSEVPITSRCLYIQVSDLLEKLKVYGFSDAIRTIRNELIHNKS